MNPNSSHSPHVLNLRGATKPEAAPAKVRPNLDFSQRLAIFWHRIHVLINPRRAHEHLGLAPARPATTPKLQAPVQKPLMGQADPAAVTEEKKATGPALPTPALATTGGEAGRAPERAQLSASTSGGKAKTGPVGAWSAKPGATRPQVCRLKPGQIAVCPLVKPSPSHHRNFLRFVLIGLLVLLPVIALTTYANLTRRAAAVTSGTKDALTNLESASFDRAATDFSEARSQLRDATVILAAYASGRGDKLAAGNAILTAGESLSRAGAKITETLATLDASSTQPLPARVSALTATLREIEPDLTTAAASLNSVSPDSLPAEYAPKFLVARDGLELARLGLDRFLKTAPAVLRMLGGEGKRRYLVVFQNDRELRPTGGFIGSFALMDVKDGKVVNMEIPPGGPYDLRAGLKERLQAPEPLRLVNPRWEFQDANWFADFPTSAKALAWFYEKSGGPTIDGVVAVTSRVMERLLDVVGPVELPEYGKVIDARNFWPETQKAVELEYDKVANKPKQIIADLAPKVLDRLMSAGTTKLPTLMTATGDALAARDVQVWFRDPEIQATADEFGWSGTLKAPTGGDFLAVVDTNIAGGKTDGVVAEDVQLETSVADDGTLVDTVTIKRTHNGKAGALFTGLKNIDYVRVYVPAGSTLLSAEGFERPGEGYFQKPDASLQPATLLTAATGRESVGPGDTIVSGESGFATFGNWIQVAPGETSSVKFTYRLPFRAADLLTAPQTTWEKVRSAVRAYVPLARWRLFVRTQAGTRDRSFSAKIRLPEDWTVRERLPAGLAPDGENGARWTGPLDHDLYLGLIAAEKK